MNKLRLGRPMCLLAICMGLSSGFLAGCTTGILDLSPAKAYRSGENFGDGGKTRCNTVQQVDGRVPFCGYPDDGDGYGQPAGGL